MFDSVRQLADHLRPADAVPDADLLARFITTHDEAAFAALLRRHGGMVFGVCRRLTATHHDAEDAFQAAFLVLAARADTVRPPDRLGAWLHGVAVNTARKAARGRRTVPLVDVPAPEPRPEWPASALLDAALLSLPPKYRLPLVLCHLEGRTRRDAANALGWPEGTVSGRLARGLRLLGDRLRRQGVGVPVVALTMVVPTQLLAATTDRAVLVAAGLSAVPTHLLPLTRGVLPMLPLRRVALLLAGLFAGTAGLFALPADEPPKPAPAPRPAKPAPHWVEVAKLDRPEPVERLAFGAAGVAFGERDGHLGFWKADFGGEPRTVAKGGPGEGHNKSVDRLVFTTDGRWLCGITNGGRGLWRFKASDMSGGHGISGDDASFHDIAPNGQTFVEKYSWVPKELRLSPNLWKGEPAAEARVVVGADATFDAEVGRGVLSADNAYLAVGLANGTVQLVARDGLKKGTILPVAGGPAVELAFSPDGNQLAVVEPGGAVTVFAHGTGVKLATLAGHDGAVAAVAFHPDGGRLATAGADKTVRVWDAATGKPVQSLRGHTGAVTAVAFSPDGKRLASGSDDKTVRVWEFRP